MARLARWTPGMYTTTIRPREAEPGLASRGTYEKIPEIGIPSPGTSGNP